MKKIGNKSEMKVVVAERGRAGWDAFSLLLKPSSIMQSSRIRVINTDNRPQPQDDEPEDDDDEQYEVRRLGITAQPTTESLR